MKVLGIVCIVVSFGGLAIIANMSNSVADSTVINFNIMFNKLFGVLICVGVMISGAIFTAVGIFYEEQFYEEIEDDETEEITEEKETIK